MFFTKDQTTDILNLYQSGLTLVEISKKYKCHWSTISKIDVTR